MKRGFGGMHHADPPSSLFPLPQTQTRLLAVSGIHTIFLKDSKAKQSQAGRSSSYIPESRRNEKSFSAPLYPFSHFQTMSQSRVNLEKETPSLTPFFPSVIHIRSRCVPLREEAKENESE